MQYSLFPEENLSSNVTDLPIKMDDLQGMESVKKMLNRSEKKRL